MTRADLTPRQYGCRPDVEDPRDKIYGVPTRVILPKTADLRLRLAPVPVEDQGQIGSCTANAWATVMEYLRIRDGRNPHLDQSRLFIYYNERMIEGTVDQDAGAQIRSGAKVLAKYGVCPEALWPYEDERLIRKPADDCYIQALGFRAIAYRRVRSLYELKHALASGLPVAIGIAVYESFESAMVAKTGDVPMPNRGWVCRESLLGWHAVTAVGYNDLERKIICRNSWGASWGRAGHFFLSYEYILDPSLSGDFWTCTQTSLDAVAMNADPESEEPINV